MEIKASEYVKIFTLLVKKFGDVDKALAWLRDFGALYKDGDFIVNAFNLKVMNEEALNEVKIFIGGEEWNE